MDYVSALAGLAAKALAEQLGDIGLIVDDQDADTHAALQRDCFASLRPPSYLAPLAGRGRTRRVRARIPGGGQRRVSQLRNFVQLAKGPSPRPSPRKRGE